MIAYIRNNRFKNLIRKDYNMNKNHLKYYNSVFLGITLFITLFLINQFKGTIVFYFAELFLIVNIIKDFIKHKLGFTFGGIGIKKMIAIDLLFLSIFIIWHITTIY